MIAFHMIVISCQSNFSVFILNQLTLFGMISTEASMAIAIEEKMSIVVEQTKLAAEKT